MTNPRWVLLAVLLSLASLGCNAGRTFIATPNDYADYRRVRIADNFDDRMAATWDQMPGPLGPSVSPEGGGPPRKRFHRG